MDTLSIIERETILREIEPTLQQWLAVNVNDTHYVVQSLLATLYLAAEQAREVPTEPILPNLQRLAGELVETLTPFMKTCRLLEP